MPERHKVGEHVSVALACEKVPAGQIVHKPAPFPGRGWMRPAGQPRQTAEPGGVAVPALHCVQLLPAGLNQPLGHAVQVVGKVELDVNPAAQLEHEPAGWPGSGW
jgi:hypothetical protein